MPTTFNSVASVLAAVGQDLGRTDYITIDQQRIDTFAEATGDDQWIHVDPVKAKDGPFGATVAHGYLTMSLANFFLPQLVHYQELKMGVNYGTDKVRFPSPVRVNSRVCGRGEVLSAEEQFTPVTYINSAADLKAFCGRHGGIVCTSSNARTIAEWAFGQHEKILFFPDQHLGRWTGHTMGIPLEEMLVWDPDLELGGLTP